PLAHGSSASTSGTRVVLPAPGGATRTAVLDVRIAAVSAGNASSIGRAESKIIGLHMVNTFLIRAPARSLLRKAEFNARRAKWHTWERIWDRPAPRASTGSITPRASASSWW